MKILDKYILKKYLITFLFTLLILIPIAVAIDISEKINTFTRYESLTVFEIAKDYYLNFIIYYSNTFMPLGLFISVILFTSKMANNTEIVAINGAQISFTRFLYPYFVGGTIITGLALVMNHFVVPNSNKIRNRFESTYIHGKKYSDRNISDFSLQINDSTNIFIQSYDLERNSGYNFSIDTYKGLELKTKLISEAINYNSQDSTFQLIEWRLRKIFKNKDSIFSGNQIDTTFSFTPKDFVYKSAFAQDMNSTELSEFIKISKKRGVKNLNAYLVELHKRTSLPIASYILTLIAVSLGARKRRGGIGVNMAIGIALMFSYVFFLKVSEVLGGVAGANSLLNVWFPNLLFALIAAYLYFNAKRQA